MNHVLYCDDKTLSAYVLFSSYFYALQNLFGNENITKFSTLNDVQTNDTIFVVDDHFGPNASIFMEPGFINYCNSHNVQLVFFCTERMTSPYWNHDHTIQKQALFKNVKNFYGDANDIDRFGTKFVVKQLISKHFAYLKNNLTLRPEDKIPKFGFIGQIATIQQASWYSNRKKYLDYLSKQQHIPIDLMQSNKNTTFENYYETLSKYKYVINPLGVGDFINIRYYDALFCNSIPIQQSTHAMEKYYSEFSTTQGYFFQSIEELDRILIHLKEDKIVLPPTYYLEDYMLDCHLIELTKNTF